MNDINDDKQSHYYGDIVRMLFMAAALVMLVGLPSIVNYLAFPTVISVAAILVLGLVAGITNPRQTWAAGLNMTVSLIGFLVFESYAVMAFQKYSANDKFFIANLALGFVFLFATYFSVKTFRGLMLKKNDSPIHTPLEDLLNVKKSKK